LFKNIRFRGTPNKGNLVEKEVKDRHMRRANRYCGTEHSHNIEHKSEKEQLKKEYVRRMRLAFDTELSAKD
jgi:hypothetical protein